jgi:hypothetical protein
MNLRQALLLPELANLTDQQILDHGNTAGPPLVINDLWRYIGIADRFGVTVAETIHGVLLAQNLPGGAASYINPGINLSTPEVQSQLDALSAAYPSLASVFSQLKELGLRTQTLWQYWGVGPSPTLAEIAAAKEQNITQQKIINFCNTIWAPAISHPDMTIETLKSLVANDNNWTL